MKKKFNIKVDGKQLDKEIDLGNEAEVIKILQMAEMAQSRAKEAADLRKTDLQKTQEMEQFLAALKNDPRSVLEYMGHNVPELADKILQEEIKKMQMSPEEKERQAMKEELQKLKEEKDQFEKSAKEKEAQALRAKYAAEYEKDLVTALDSASLPKNPEVVTRMTNMMKIALANKIDISFSDLIPIVKEEMNKDLKALLASLKSEEVEQILGEEMLKGINSRRRKAQEAAKAKEAPPIAQQIKDATPAKVQEKVEEKKKINARDFFKSLK